MQKRQRLNRRPGDFWKPLAVVLAGAAWVGAAAFFMSRGANGEMAAGRYAAVGSAAPTGLPPARVFQQLGRQRLSGAAATAQQAVPVTFQPVRSLAGEVLSAATRTVPATDSPDGESGGAGAGVQRRVTASLDADGGRHVLQNQTIQAALGYQGSQQGVFSVLDRATGLPLVEHAVPRLSLADGSSYLLSRDVRSIEDPEDAMQQVQDPVLGPGVRVTERFEVPQKPYKVDLQVSMFDGQQSVLLQMTVKDAPADLDGATFDFFDLDSTRVAIGNPAAYVTEYGKVRQNRLAGGVKYDEWVKEGKPVLLMGGKGSRNLVLAALDDPGAPAHFAVQLAADGSAAGIAFSVNSLPRLGDLKSPRLFLDFPAGGSPAEALASFRKTFAALYPPLSVPDWYRFEWNSWYPFGLDINERNIRAQMDYAGKWLRDLGPWQMELDAGWYVAEGRAGGDWMKADAQKFPAGLRSLTDYAHRLGQHISLYFSAPYVDNRAVAGNWLGLPKLIDEHPDFLVKVDEDSDGTGYVFDARQPSFQRYLRDFLQRALMDYQFDGLAVDALGGTPLGLDPSTLGYRSGVQAVATKQTMELYRLIHSYARALRPDAHILSGWDLPLFANVHSDAFWHSDEVSAFSAPYPNGGLQEHIDYAMLQEVMLGQRSHMGYIMGDPNSDAVARWWLEAAVALGSQVGLSFDLESMSPQALSQFRELLAVYRPHQGRAFLVGSYPSPVFGVERDGTVYLGVINREVSPQEFPVALTDLGLSGSVDYTVYDAAMRQYSTASGALSVPMPPQSFRLLVLRRGSGLIWTNSTVTQRASRNTLELNVSGPDGLAGFADIIAPPSSTILFDGQTLDPDGADQPATATFEADGILRLRYTLGAPHTVKLTWP